MKILWFTNSTSCFVPSKEKSKKGYNGGGWISSAEKSIKNYSNIELAVSFMLDGEQFKVSQNNTTYYPIPNPNKSVISKIFKAIKIIIEDRHAHNVETQSWDYYLNYFKRIIDDYNPDIIHVWGSERQFGLIWKVTEKPVVLHIQGIITPYINAFLPPFVSWGGFIWQSINPIRLIQNYLVRKQWEDQAYREQEIYKGLRLVMGRTNWDRHVSHVLNPELAYRRVDEILREDFYECEKRKIPSILTIITTISNPLYKGFDLVLKTAYLLINNLKVDFDWQCFGNINPNFIEQTVGICHKDVNVRLMGVASSKRLREAELNATLYFHSSYIDNSPNSLCEAQMLGLPIVSTNVGGIPSLVTHGEDGFLAPSNDPFQCACYIERLALDTTLNIMMGRKGQEKAYVRHNKERIIKQLKDLYYTTNI